MCKGRYNGNLRKVDIRAVYAKAVWRIVDGEKYSERLILENVKQ